MKIRNNSVKVIKVGGTYLMPNEEKDGFTKEVVENPSVKVLASMKQITITEEPQLKKPVPQKEVKAEPAPVVEEPVVEQSEEKQEEPEVKKTEGKKPVRKTAKKQPAKKAEN